MRSRSLAILGLALALTACPSVESASSDEVTALTDSPPAGAASASPTGETAMATASPSGEPTPSPTPALGPDAVAQVATTDLVMRSAPGVGQDSEIFDRLLSRPQLVYLLDGPVGADGYDWYLAAPFRVEVAPSIPRDDLIGWVAAASRAGEPWIAPTELECPGPTLDAISAQSPIANLACYGGQQLAFEGVFNGCFAVSPVTVEPSWLSGSGCSVLVLGSEPTALPTGGVLVVRPAARSGAPDRPGTPVFVQGHFDDPEATTCRRLAVGVLPVGVASTILWCRTQFVATDF